MKIHLFTTSSTIILIALLVLGVGVTAGLRMRLGRARHDPVQSLGRTPPITSNGAELRGEEVARHRRGPSDGVSALMLAFQALTAASAVMIAVTAWDAKSAGEDHPGVNGSLKPAGFPMLKIQAAQIWIAGKGKPFDPSNKSPDIAPGQKIDGSLDLHNVGSEPALVLESDLVVRWLDRLPMQNPMWEEHSENVAKTVQANTISYKAALSAEPDDPHLATGRSRRWFFSTIVPTDIGGRKMYLIGRVSYADQAGFQHSFRFVRWYAPDRQRFAQLDKPDDDYEGVE